MCVCVGGGGGGGGGGGYIGIYSLNMTKYIETQKVVTAWIYSIWNNK